MFPQKRSGLVAAAATLLTVVWTATGEAQIRYPYPYPYPPPYRYAAPDSAVRLEVSPREAEVYVDGYYAGIVDDFDGIFQRLHVPAGQHDITLYRDGYRSVTQKIYLTPDSSFKIKYQMEPLAPGDVAEARPVPTLQPPVQPAPPVTPRGPIGRRAPPPNAPPPPGVPPPGAPPPLGTPPPAAPSGNGTLAIHIEPADAEVLIDGQPWRAPEGQDRLVVDASVGRHTIQIRKQGYVGYLTEVEVRRGETTPLDVRLRTQP